MDDTETSFTPADSVSAAILEDRRKLREIWNFANRYEDFVELFHNESDRAAAIVAASFADAFFGEVLQDYFVKHKRSKDFFQPMKPLGSFSARTEILFLLGMMPDAVRRDLELIRKVRNYFAHHPKAVTFEEVPVRDLCGALSTAQPFDRADGSAVNVARSRDRFLLALALAMFQVRQISLRFRRRTIPLEEADRVIE